MKDNYLELTTNFLRCYEKSDIKTILITGTTSGVGVSTTATNFAEVLSRYSQLKVLLVSNFRESPPPNIVEIDSYEVDSDLGAQELSTTSFRSADFPEIRLIQRQRNLKLLRNYGPFVDAMRFAQSDLISKILWTARSQNDYVVFDGAPILKYPEYLLISARVDGVILVIEAGKTKQQIAQATIKKIEQSGGKLLGIVLNRRKHYIPEWIYRHL